MSQFYVTPPGGSPAIPTSFVTDSGTAIPVANTLNIKARDTNENNDNGIRTKADPNGSDDLFIELTNRITGTITTTDATPTTLITLPLGAVAGTYIVEGDLTAYNTTDVAGASYTFVGAAVTDGATATEIGVENKNVFEQPAMTAADFALGVTGNDAFIQVTGIAGKTINWSALFTYRFVG